ncbi:polysaccharide deacetylase family protein [Yimella sp. cx-51]|uniref:polysaccharide deacetylase family protein n=1 Tax=Yimella sp. cx-51 TaxID=2770551 RepID=UPI00165DA9EC|nr:polysaccharide deacetylase family protein [Yimella sp. cx-51]MBC9955831.1 polysaccharide deacetylase family protein [Yimella sp. cx-51]MBD2757994.1 polysaccharide deacetylase family protein [Yimella sp. cx-573]QTH37619.1 polysaccharide deacetylase family protein [Yimella sp. cx-51]
MTESGGQARRRVIMVGGSAVLGALGGAALNDEAVAYEVTHRPPSYRVAPPAPRTGAFVAPVVWRAAGGGVALTFDDGPDPRWTPRILDILKQNRCLATFFVLRTQVLKHPDLLRRIVAEGHQIGVHGVAHVDMTTLDAAALEREFDLSIDTVRTIGGVTATVMRPPYGRFDAPVLQRATAAGLQMVLWSDWLPGKHSAAAAGVLERDLTNGSIVLCHDSRRTPSEGMIAALRGFVPRLQSRGHELVTVDGLLGPDAAPGSKR